MLSFVFGPISQWWRITWRFKKNSRIRIRIFTKIEIICPCHTLNLFTKFRPNPSITFWDVLLKVKQTSSVGQEDLPCTNSMIQPNVHKYVHWSPLSWKKDVNMEKKLFWSTFCHSLFGPISKCRFFSISTISWGSWNLCTLILQYLSSYSLKWT